MNNKTSTQELVLSGLLLASGVLFPMIFHIFGITGQIFLPMHIPVLIGGMLVSTNIALFIGILTPIISSLLTGMPVIFPIAIIMAVELGAYGVTASFFVRKLKFSVIVALILSMIAGRISAGLTVAVLVQLFGIKMNPVIYIKGAIVAGLPGIIIQIIFIPSVIYLLKLFIKGSSTQV